MGSCTIAGRNTEMGAKEVQGGPTEESERQTPVGRNLRIDDGDPACICSGAGYLPRCRRLVCCV